MNHMKTMFNRKMPAIWLILTALLISSCIYNSCTTGKNAKKITQEPKKLNHEMLKHEQAWTRVNSFSS